jgi:hypothetical protein
MATAMDNDNRCIQHGGTFPAVMRGVCGRGWGMSPTAAVATTTPWSGHAHRGGQCSVPRWWCSWVHVLRVPTVCTCTHPRRLHSSLCELNAVSHALMPIAAPSVQYRGGGPPGVLGPPVCVTWALRRGAMCLMALPRACAAACVACCCLCSGFCVGAAPQRASDAHTLRRWHLQAGGVSVECIECSVLNRWGLLGAWRTV